MDNQRPINQIVGACLTQLAEPLTPESNTSYPSVCEFQTFQNPSLEKAHHEINKLASVIGENVQKPYWVTLLGPSGTGKTFLAKKVYDMVGRIVEPPNGPWDTLLYPNRFVVWPRLCDKLRDGKWYLIDEICDAYFVVLDEIGAEYDPTGLMLNKLDQICNSRLGKWTVITGNMTYAEIGSRVDPRIASRMIRANGVVCEIDSPDYNTRTP